MKVRRNCLNAEHTNEWFVQRPTCSNNKTCIACAALGGVRLHTRDNPYSEPPADWVTCGSRIYCSCTSTNSFSVASSVSLSNTGSDLNETKKSMLCIAE